MSEKPMVQNKIALALENIDGGKLAKRVNDLLASMNTEVSESDNAKAVATIKIEIKIARADEEDCFRNVTSKVAFAAPAPAARKEFLPIRTIEGKRVMALDVDPKAGDNQMQIPGAKVTPISGAKSAQG